MHILEKRTSSAKIRFYKTPITMSGHNKWSKIKHKKAATDAKKSKEFSKLVRDIKVAVKEARGDEQSPSVQLAVARAKAANMPKENIARAIQSGQGGNEKELERVRYETYGPGGVAILIEAVTDNKNRTAAEIKKLLADHGSELAAPGSAAWAFEQTQDGWRAKQSIESVEKDAPALLGLVNSLEAHDDVVQVITNTA